MERVHKHSGLDLSPSDQKSNGRQDWTPDWTNRKGSLEERQSKEELDLCGLDRGGHWVNVNDFWGVFD